MAARQIIVLETNPADGGQIAVRAAFWFPVTAGQEVPKPGFVSAITKDPFKPTAQEATDLQDGKVFEEVKSFSFPDNTLAATIKSSLVSFYQRRAAYLATMPFQGKFYGVSYDGAAWSA
jgi:hypothetical protein